MTSKWHLSLAAVFLFACAILSHAVLRQTGSGNTPRPPARDLQAAPDLNERLAKFRLVPMPFHSEGLSAREQALVKQLVEASQYLEQIYWRQSDPEGLALLRSLESSKTPADVALRRFFLFNATHHHLVRNNEPFVGTAPMSPGRGLYP